MIHKTQEANDFIGFLHIQNICAIYKEDSLMNKAIFTEVKETTHYGIIKQKVFIGSWN